MGRNGEMHCGRSISIGNDWLKPYAWSTGKGQRVFNQIRAFGVIGDYDADRNGLLSARIYFDSGTDDEEMAHTLQDYVSDLVAKFVEEGLDVFERADMTLYA
jgi:hypothetical protein